MSAKICILTERARNLIIGKRKKLNKELMTEQSRYIYNRGKPYVEDVVCSNCGAQIPLESEYVSKPTGSNSGARAKFYCMSCAEQKQVI